MYMCMVVVYKTADFFFLKSIRFCFRRIISWIKQIHTNKSLLLARLDIFDLSMICNTIMKIVAEDEKEYTWTEEGVFC